MFTLDDIRVIEEDENATREEECVALQRAINDGLWSLQGSYGRAMMGAIENGECMLGPNPAKDYWGNVIPARKWVQEGTKGSRSYVVERKGEDWAKMLEAA